MNKTLYQAALKMLARREHSAQELNQKLKAKNFDLDEIKKIIVLLEEKKYVSDARFAEIYVRHRSQKGFGKCRIEAELKERGISQALIKQALEENSSADIKKIYEKKFGLLNRQQFKQLDMKEKAKRMRYLQYKGFSQQELHQLFNQQGSTL